MSFNTNMWNQTLKLCHVSTWQKVDHWPRIDDRLFSFDDCVNEMDELKMHEGKDKYMRKGKNNQKHSRKKRKFFYADNLLWDFPILYSLHKDVGEYSGWKRKMNWVGGRINEWMNGSMDGWVRESVYLVHEWMNDSMS